MKNKEWIIIGAGAAGLSAAISLGRAGQQVTLLERNSKAGRKIRASGNGKCNISNKNIDPIYFHSTYPDFVTTLLQGFGFERIEAFFRSIGLPLTEGKEGRVFPMSLQASTVVELLLYEAQSVGVEIFYDCMIDKIARKHSTFVLETSYGTLSCSSLLIATGSPAAPQLGGNDSGYSFATEMGHSLIPRYPSLVQLCTGERWVRMCTGVKIAGRATLYANGRQIVTTEGDILFTNYGISGLAILDLSREASRRLANFEYCELSLDLLPAYSKEKLANLLLAHINREGQKPLTLWLQGILHKKLIPIILKQSGCSAQTERDLNRKEINKLIHSIKHLKLSISDTKGFEGAEVATGGINTQEVDPQTLESKLVPRLHFGGEILDVDGDRGGYNFHFAWVCGLRIGEIRN